VALVFEIMVNLGLSRNVLKQLPTIHSLPGYYGFDHCIEHKRRLHLVSIGEAEKLAIGIYGTVEKMERVFNKGVRTEASKYNNILRKWEIEHGWKDLSDGGPWPPRRPHIPRYLKIQPVHDESFREWRFMGSTSFPYWDSHNHTLESGVYCRACTCDWEEREDVYSRREHKLVRRRYHQAFLKEAMPTHFLHCKSLKKGYNLEDLVKELAWPYERTVGDFLVLVADDTESSTNVRVRKKSTRLRGH
jgi:hypothetical protein